MRKARRSQQDTLRQRLQIELGFNGTRISPAKVMTPGRDIATVTLQFKVRGHDLIGRQSHRYADPWSRVSSSIERNDYDTAGFVAVLRHRQITPHVVQNTVNRRSAIDGRTTRHPGYAISQQKRKRVE